MVRVPFGPVGEHSDLRTALLEHVGRDRFVGAILVRRGGHAVGVFDGRVLRTSKVGRGYVQGRTKAGGGRSSVTRGAVRSRPIRRTPRRQTRRLRSSSRSQTTWQPWSAAGTAAVKTRCSPTKGRSHYERCGAEGCCPRRIRDWTCCAGSVTSCGRWRSDSTLLPDPS